MRLLGYELTITDIIAIVGAIALIWKTWQGSIGSSADAMQTFQEMLTSTARECKDLRVDVDYLQDELRYYKLGVAKLLLQLERLGIEPDWRPRE